MLHLTDL